MGPTVQQGVYMGLKEFIWDPRSLYGTHCTTRSLYGTQGVIYDSLYNKEFIIGLLCNHNKPRTYMGLV